MREKLKKLLGAALGSGIIFLLLFGVFAVIALFSGGLMGLFGFQYDSVGQLLLYFLLGGLLGLPLESFSAALPRALYRLEKVDRRQGNLLYIPLDTLFTFAAFRLADRWMDSVSATGLSLWILGLGMALLTLPIPKERGERDGMD